jgi:hypothetical protein
MGRDLSRNVVVAVVVVVGGGGGGSCILQYLIYRLANIKEAGMLGGCVRMLLLLFWTPIHK